MLAKRIIPCLAMLSLVVSAAGIDFAALKSPIILSGGPTRSCRDPAVIYSNGVFYLFFTLGRLEPDGHYYLYTAESKSRNLVDWSEPHFLTPHSLSLNFCSPGDVVPFGNEWILCFCSYPRPNGERYANDTARLWTMRSPDLDHWSEPELLRVKGPEVPVEQMGRMIDPYLFQDKDDPGKWWCFYKQNGASLSWTRDFKTWTYSGHVDAGENVCVLVENGEYVMFHSPANGIGVKRSTDLKTWRDDGLITLGQKDWEWARGRITAGFVLDLRKEPGIGKYLMFFHGSGPESDLNSFASLGLAWSDDLVNWDWPGRAARNSAQSLEPAKPRFALYMEKTHDADFQQSELESEPLITEQDILSYDWPTHTIMLTEPGEKKIFDRKTEGTRGKEFVVVADGQRCYRGAFWLAIWSVSHGEPVIDLYKRGSTIQIERAYPSADFATGDDPRSDPRIQRVLEAEGKIRGVQPTGPAGTAKPGN